MADGPAAGTELVPPGAWIDIVGAVGWDESSECWPQLVAAVEEAARQAIEQHKIGAGSVVDSELRDLPEQVFAELDRHLYWHPGKCECGWKIDEAGDVDWSLQWRMHVAQSMVAARVAPVLAANEKRLASYEHLIKHAKKVEDMLRDQLHQARDIDLASADANLREINLQLAEMIDADEEEALPDLLARVKAELDLRWATRQQYAEERDAAQAAIRDIDAHATPVGLLHEDDPEGSPHHYLVTVGALHRALGKSDGTGVKCDRERDVLRWLHAEARYHRDVAHQMLERLETQHVTWTVAGSTEEIHPDWCRECRVDKLRAELQRERESRQAEQPPVSLRQQLFDRLAELVDPADRDDLVGDVLALMAGHLQQQSLSHLESLREKNGINEKLMAELEQERARHAQRDEINTEWVKFGDRVLDERRKLRTDLSHALGIAADERGLYPPIPVLLEVAANVRAERDELRAHGVARDIGQANDQMRANAERDARVIDGLRGERISLWEERDRLRAELDALKTKQVWRTAPISGVMHLVPRGDGRRESVCGLTASTTWREAIDGNARCRECMRWQPDTEATEQAPNGLCCDRKANHPGMCMARCSATPGCTEPSGHRGRCTTGTYNQIGWADPASATPTEQAEPRKSCPECSAQPWRPHNDDCPILNLCQRCGHEHDGSCSTDCLGCPPCTSTFTVAGQTHTCALRGPHKESLHLNNVRRHDTVWSDDQADAPAIPTEPRVWRRGDPEPGPDVYGVQLNNGETFKRYLGAGGRWWAHDTGSLWSWRGIWEETGRDFVTEVTVDQAPGGNQ